MSVPESDPCVSHDVTLDVWGLDASDAYRVMEVLSRTAVGLGLDGFAASVRIEQVSHHHMPAADKVEP